MKNKLKTPAEIQAIVRSGQLLAEVLVYLKNQVKAGITTGQLSDLATQKLIDLRAGEPAFFRLQRLPPSVICISLNDEVVHGLPGSRELSQDDIISLDYGVKFEGMITDAAITLSVGNKPSANTKKLIIATREALAAGIAQAWPGKRIGDISFAIEQRLKQDGLGVIENLVGHGVGHFLHEDPAIPNFGRPHTGLKLKSGMTLAIEPMATLGGKDILLDDDGWTIRTLDHSLSAHLNILF